MKSLFATLSLLPLLAVLSACNSSDKDAEIPLVCLSPKAVAGFLQESESASEYQLTPHKLQTLFANNNMTILQAANRVHKAKEALNLARAQLLPSVNLAELVTTAANPSFLAAQFDILLPFLLPSKWFDLGAQSNVTRAEEMGFLLTELNEFASVYGIYLSMLTDYTAREFLYQDLQDSLTVERLVRESYEVGQATSADLDSARSQVLTANTRFTKLEELLADETANLKFSLGLCPEVNISLENHDLPPLEIENMTIRQATEAALTQAPEAKQIAYLIQAARYEKWSKIFGIINGASVMGQAGASGDAFSNLNPVGSVGFGLGYFVGLSLSNRNLEQLTIQKANLGAITLKLMDSTLTRLILTSQRIENASQAELLLERIFESEKHRYAIGETTLLSLTESQGRLRQGRLDAVRARADLKAERLTLHRLMRSEEFAEMKGCTPESPCTLDVLQKKLGTK